MKRPRPSLTLRLDLIMLSHFQVRDAVVLHTHCIIWQQMIVNYSYVLNNEKLSSGKC